MKSQKLIFFLLGLILTPIVANSCVKSNGLPGTPSRQASSTLLASQVSPTSIQIISSATPSFTSTPTPILIPVPTHTPTSSATPTVIPTLVVDAARLRLIELLANNGNCRLPCLWGITPGKSTYRDAKAVLAPLSSISDLTFFEPGAGSILPTYTEGDLKISLYLNFLASNNIVSKISFAADALKETIAERGVYYVFDAKPFGERLSFYMLPQILSEYGRPSTVMLKTLAKIPPSNRDPGVHFQILILYPDEGILVNYTTEMSVVGENVVGCPANAHIEMELYPSGNSKSFFEMLARTQWSENIKNNYKPLDEVTSMSLDEFYQTFRQPTDECLETPANLWPMPER